MYIIEPRIEWELGKRKRKHAWEERDMSLRLSQRKKHVLGNL
jgi:hypothetical protein